MIIYATKLTFERYSKLKLPCDLAPPMNIIMQSVIDKERGDRLLEWGAKLFYFDKRKCIQLVNFASKLTLFLVDIKVADLENLGNMISYYLLDLYKDDKEMVVALEKLFEESPAVCFDKLTDKSAIATLNHTQLDFALDGYRFYDYICDGILHTVEINHDFNFMRPVFIKIDGKKEVIFTGEKFRELVLARTATSKPLNVINKINRFNGRS